MRCLINHPARTRIVLQLGPFFCFSDGPASRLKAALNTNSKCFGDSLPRSRLNCSGPLIWHDGRCSFCDKCRQGVFESILFRCDSTRLEFSASEDGVNREGRLDVDRSGRLLIAFGDASLGQPEARTLELSKDLRVVLCLLHSNVTLR
jgi:hypothetical protein